MSTTVESPSVVVCSNCRSWLTDKLEGQES